MNIIKLTFSKNFDAGWDQVCYRALIPYIALNLIYCFPETWDDASGKTDEKDYRLMRVYRVRPIQKRHRTGLVRQVAV